MMRWCVAVLLLAWEISGIPTNLGLDHVGFTVPDAEEASVFLRELFDCRLDWEIRRGPKPSAGERGWDKIFAIHPDAYLAHVVMLQCGRHHLAQYIELFEWNVPDRREGDATWGMPFTTVGHGYISFTVQNISRVMQAIKDSKYWGSVRFLQDPPMTFPLRDELCTSTFLVAPWGQWIELTEWSKSGPLGTPISGEVREGEQCEDGTRGMRRVDDLNTPAWVIDLDKMDHNIALFKSRLGNVAWRPPVKAHKSPGLAKRLLAAGAQGILTLTVPEAEGFAMAGIDDIYVANCIVSQPMIARLVRLAGRTKRTRVHVDSEANLLQIAEVADKAGLSVEVLVEVNVGHNRTGVDGPEAAAELAAAVAREEKRNGAVRFVGIAGYEGHTPVLPAEKKAEETRKAHAKLAEAKAAIEAAGIEVGVVTGGGSCNYIDALATGVLTELEAGGAALVDKLYNTSAGLGEHGHQIGSFVITTVVSVAADGSRAMADAGFKAVGWHPFAGLPVIMSEGHENVEVAGLSAEHLKLKPREGRLTLKPGDRLLLTPGYTDAMGLMHDTVYGVRNGVVEEEWAVLKTGPNTVPR